MASADPIGKYSFKLFMTDEIDIFTGCHGIEFPGTLTVDVLAPLPGPTFDDAVNFLNTALPR